MLKKQKFIVSQNALGGFYSLPARAREIKARTLLLVFFLFGCATLTAAQTDDNPRFEFFAGYSVLGINYKDPEPSNPPIPSATAFDGKQFMNKGFNVSATGYLTKRFGLTADFSAHFKTNKIPDALGGNIEDNIRVLNILGGPQYKFRNSSRVTPFVRGLAGIAVTSNNLKVSSLNIEHTFSSTDFALALGGGLDVRLNRRVDLRLVQVDYNPVFLKRDNELGFGRRADNVRFSFGVVFK